MKRGLEFVAVAVVGLAVLVPGVLLAQSNPLIGIWKLNIARSRFSPGPAPRSMTITIEAQGDGINLRADGTAPDGSRFAYGYMAKYDGKDNAIFGDGSTERSRYDCFRAYQLEHDRRDS